ncbi:MAG: NADH-quinone oxidoreductase subunit N [Planctomycetes bacterium]|nr:NADH-quinone oxidoreductase subunit N [Planctomycetota bacterium]
MPTFGTAELLSLLPFGCPLLGALVVLLMDPFLVKDRPKLPLAYVGLASMLCAWASLGFLWGDRTVAWSGALAIDRFGLFLSFAIITVGALTVFATTEYARQAGIDCGEYYALLLTATSGMVLLAMANDLLLVFLGIEVMSISVYALAGITRTRQRSIEAAMKYFLLGAFATAFVLYGIALIYGATGEIRLDRIAHHMANTSLLAAGLTFLVIGFGFKVGAAPFHMWTPDAYEGAPASVTGFMAAGVKAAGFAAFLRVLVVAFGAGASSPEVSVVWTDLLWLASAGSMLLGNLAALAQTNLKRMLAWSSVAHTGYALLGIVAGEGRVGAGSAAALFYVFGYSFMTLGPFLVIALLSRNGEDFETIDDLAGLGQRRPLAAGALSLFLLSLAGLPPTVGFVGKLYVFRSAFDGGWIYLTVLGVVTTLLSVYYYLRPIVLMYMRDARRELPVAVPADWTTHFAIGLTAAAVLLLGLTPSGYLDAALAGVLSLR